MGVLEKSWTFLSVKEWEPWSDDTVKCILHELGIYTMIVDFLVLHFTGGVNT